MTEVFKTIRGENKSFTNKFLSQERINYQLRTSNTLNFPKVTGSKHGFYTYEFGTSQLWKQVTDSIKSITLTKYFKTEIFKGWKVIKCTCSVCK